MLKYALLASAMILSAPALAQDKPAKPTTPPAAQPAPVAPVQTAPADPAQPEAAMPAQPSSPAQDSTAMTTPTDPAAPAQQAAAQPVTKAEQIAQVVNTEFVSYDKDKNGTLSATEFDAWMVALKTAADPATKADAPATRTWLSQAFAQADIDKNKAVSKAELTGFLATGNS